jgi:hypothetical protein
MSLKQEATILGWRLFIKNVTGKEPAIVRTDNSVDIVMDSVQLKQMQSYIGESFSTNPFKKKKVETEESSGVSVNVSSVLIPLAIQKFGFYLIGISAAFYLLGRYTK